MRGKESPAAFGNNSGKLFTDEDGNFISPIASAGDGAFTCSSPIDLIFVKKISIRLLVLCKSPDNSEQSQQTNLELRGYLTKVYNTFVQTHGLSALNESELDKRLTQASTKWWEKLRDGSALKANESVGQPGSISEFTSQGLFRSQAQPSGPQGNKNVVCACSIS